MSKFIKILAVCGFSLFAAMHSYGGDTKSPLKTVKMTKVTINKSSNAVNTVSDQSVIHKIDLNKATANEIAKFNGFGPKRSQAIVEYRDTHGVFKSFNDLSLVKGISKRFIEKNLEKLQQTFVI